MTSDHFKELLKLPLFELISIADKVRGKKSISELDLCSIMNAKSGLCSEDCKFCAQSSHYSTGASSYPLKSKKEMIEGAIYAKKIGAHRFDIVTSGNTLTKEDSEIIIETISEITRDVGINMCASLGRLTKGQLQQLKDAGLTRYHHNIETSRNFYPNIVTTHNYDERIDIIGAIKEIGLEACSGGIIGLGESWQDRIDMAIELKQLNVDSVPLNVLVPIKGTPLEGSNNISPLDAIRTIAIFRIILEDKIIKVAAGRESILKDYQVLAFMAGANGMLIGGYLTIKGREIEEDQKLIEQVEEMWQHK